MRNVTGNRLEPVWMAAAAVALVAWSSTASAVEPPPWPPQDSSTFPRGGKYIQAIRLLKIEGADSGRATAVLRVGDAIFLAGKEYSRETSSRLWVWKLNFTGDVIWRTRITPPEGLNGGGGGPNLVGLLSNGQGSIRAIASWYRSPRRDPTFAVDIDESGAVTETTALGTFANPTGVLADGGGGAFLFGVGKNEAWIGRFDNQPKMLWQNEYSPRPQRDATEKSAEELTTASGFYNTKFLFDGELFDDGSAALIGISGAFNKFGQGVSKLWLLRVAADGEKMDETLIDGGRVFPSGSLITRHGDGIAVAYTRRQLPPINRIPTGSLPELRSTVAKFNLRLQSEWEKPGSLTSLLGAGSINGAKPTIMVGEGQDLPVCGLGADGNIAWETKIETPEGFTTPFMTLRHDEDAIVIANYRVRRGGDTGVLLAWVTPPSSD